MPSGKKLSFVHLNDIKQFTGRGLRATKMNSVSKVNTNEDDLLKKFIDLILKFNDDFE